MLLPQAASKYPLKILNYSYGFVGQSVQNFAFANDQIRLRFRLGLMLRLRIRLRLRLRLRLSVTVIVVRGLLEQQQRKRFYLDKLR